MLFERLNTPSLSLLFFVESRTTQKQEHSSVKVTVSCGKKKHKNIVLLATPVHNHLPWLLQTVQAVVGVSVRFWLIQEQAVFRLKIGNNPWGHCYGMHVCFEISFTPPPPTPLRCLRTTSMPFCKSYRCLWHCYSWVMLTIEAFLIHFVAEFGIQCHKKSLVCFSASMLWR